MNNLEKPVAISPNHGAEEEAVKALMAAGFALKNLGVVGKSYRSEEKIVGFYNIGDRIKFGARAARSGDCSLAEFFWPLLEQGQSWRSAFLRRLSFPAPRARFLTVACRTLQHRCAERQRDSRRVRH
jgi:hypothetical protein